MKLGEDFKFCDDLYDPKRDNETLPIKMLIPPYEGVIFRYTRVAIKENANKDGAVMQFDYDFIDPGKNSMASLRSDDKFNTTIGLVLNEILLTYMEEGEMDGQKDRRDDSEKFDTE